MNYRLNSSPPNPDAYRLANVDVIPPTSSIRTRPKRPVHLLLRATIPIFLLLLSVSHSRGQMWQWVYGENETYHEGRRGVRPTSLNCTGVVDGYIAVGTSFSSGDAGDVYVVRTDNAGNTQWERTFSLGSTADDRGESIIEVSDGFVIVGHTTDNSGDADVLLIKIECDGSEVWTQTFGGSTSDEFGFDVIEAATGSSAGYLVVAGTIDFGTTAQGYLLRTTANGAYDWDYAYDLGSSLDVRFWSLTEVAPIPSLQTEGDIVAVGRAGDYGDQIFQGYVIRVNGVNGSINTSGGLLQGSALYGGSQDEQFYSVVELRNPSEIGTEGQPNVVVAGYSNSFSEEIADDINIYLVKLEDGDPCVDIEQKIVGTLLEESTEIAHCVREITFTPATDSEYEQWDLVVAGFTDILSDPGDMLVVTVDGATLNPNGDMQGFGHDAGIEDAWSIYPIEADDERTEGFIVCGLTETPWHTGSYDDPRDLYLVKTNNQVRTISCDPSYGPTYEDPEWEPECLEPNYSSQGFFASPSPSETPVNWDDIVCTNSGNDGWAKRIILSNETDDLLTTAPNPLTRGRHLVLILDAFNTDLDLSLTVTNSLGEVIESNFDEFMPANGELHIGTKEWPAGVYYIEVKNGEKRWTTQVIVLE